MLANAIMVILLQYINVLNQNIVLLKFTQCYMSIISQFKFFFSEGGNGNPLQYSSLENPMDRGAWQEPGSPWSPKELDTTERLNKKCKGILNQRSKEKEKSNHTQVPLITYRVQKAQ